MLGGGLVVAVVAAVAVVVAGRGEGTPSGCLSELARHVPPDRGVIQGSDLERARVAGMDDSGGVAGALDWLIETGVAPDPLTTNAQRALVDDSSEMLGYEPADVRCWTGSFTSFAAQGSFDAGRIEATDLGSSGELWVDGDVLVHQETATDRSAGERGLSSAAASLLRALDDHGVVAFSGLSADDAGDQWTGVGLARSGGWELLIVWVFTDGAEAEAGESDVREALAGASSVGELVEGDPLERIQRDGATLWLRAPLVAETTSDWYRLQSVLDPIFLIPGD
jgi:hypothetical protein